MASTIQSNRESSYLNGSVYLITSDGRILNLPIPSPSRRDPLNWNLKKRALAILSIWFFTFVGAILVQGASLAMNGLRDEFSFEETKPFSIDTLVSAPTFCIGLGTFIWAPLSLAVGRRPVFILCNILMLLATLGAGFARTFPELLAAVCVIGLAYGFFLTTALLVLIDLTFIHQRPLIIAVVLSTGGFCSLFALASIPFMTGSGIRWRDFYSYWSIPSAISCIMAFLLFPETYFKRPAVAFDGHIIMQSVTEKLIIYDDEIDNFRDKELPDAPAQSPWLEFTERLRMPRVTAGCWKAMARCYPQILLSFLNPLIFWVVLLNAVAFAGMMFIGETYALVLMEEPYRLPNRLLVLVNFSAGVGSLLAWPVSGPMVARLCKSLTMRNRGIREVEHYLVAFVLPVLAGAASTLLYGLTVRYQWHFSLVYVSYGLNGFSYIGLSIADTLWVTEAFPRWAAPALVVVGGGGYMTSFGLSFILFPWLHSQGALRVGVQLTALQLGFGAIMVPLALWGRKARKYIHNSWGMWTDGALRPQ